MHEHAVVYHRFNLGEERRVWEDKRNPILASIATLRAVNQDVKIYVLDVRGHWEDWGGFPLWLNFHVIHYPRQFPIPVEEFPPQMSLVTTRIFDVWAFAQVIPEPIVIYSDSDVFWKSNPIPLAHTPTTGFYGDARGAGFFYFRTRSLDTEVFVNTWKCGVIGPFMCDDIRTKMRITGYHMPYFMDEMAYCFLIKNGMTRGFKPTDPLEHYWLAPLSDPINPNAKCYHAHSGQFGYDRLRVARQIREFANGIRAALPPDAAGLLLGDVEPDTDFVDIKKLMTLKFS